MAEVVATAASSSHDKSLRAVFQRDDETMDTRTQPGREGSGDHTKRGARLE
jgi:hypothetical protein